MIKVENLTKIYNNKRGLIVRALNDISFTLPDTGMVFILGKSGSGKSTLLNILGGLDSSTNGDIIIDDNCFSNFSMRDFDDFHNEWLGFVFQDFCLINDLNIYQNIAISLDLQGKKDDEEYHNKINDILSLVELEGMGSRRVSELSGGQKQRIAIARALVKDPKVILADEPTGNLDSKTSKTILELLKKLSSDRLVIIVSHNNDDAIKYADRIIELADGQIIRDEIRNDKNADIGKISDGVLTLPKDRAISEEEIDSINKDISNTKIKKVELGAGTFSENNGSTTDYPMETKKLHRLKLKKRKAIRLSNSFLKSRWFSSAVTILIVSMLMFVFGLCQFITSLDTADMLADALQESEQETIMAYKGEYTDMFNLTLSTNRTLDINEDIDEFREYGYEGKIYKLYSFGINIKGSWSLMFGNTLGYKNLAEYYSKESYGTLICDMDYLQKTFGDTNGNLNLIAGELNTYPHGLVITDYLADSYFYLNNKATDYESIIEKSPFRAPINGIIDTDYETKFDGIKVLMDNMYGKWDDYTEDELNQVSNFMEQVTQTYGVCYTTNQNYVNDYATNSTGYMIILSYTVSNEDALLMTYDDSAYLYYSEAQELADNEIAVRIDTYNNWFKNTPGYVAMTDETVDTFTPITITLNKYPVSMDDDTLPEYTSEITIAKILKSSVNKGQTNDCIYAGKGFFEDMKSEELTPYAIYFDDANQAAELYDAFDELGYDLKSNLYHSVHTVGKIVRIFNQFFNIIICVIFAIGVLQLVSFARQNIKRRTYDIGVLKSLGSTTKEIGFIFGVQLFLVGLIICAVSALALFSLTGVINNVLIESLITFTGSRALSELSIIQFQPIAVLINTAFVLFIILLVIVTSIGRLHKIKPSEIIRSKE